MGTETETQRLSVQLLAGTGSFINPKEGGKEFKYKQRKRKTLSNLAYKVLYDLLALSLLPNLTDRQLE